MKNLDTKVFDNAEMVTTADGSTLSSGNLAKEMFIGTARGEQFSGLGRASTSATEKVNNYMGTARGQEMIAGMAPGAYQYMGSNIAQELGWRLPSDHLPPVEMVKEEANRIYRTELEALAELEKLERRIARIEALGMSYPAGSKQREKYLDEAKKLREITLPEMKEKIENIRKYGRP